MRRSTQLKTGVSTCMHTAKNSPTFVDVMVSIPTTFRKEMSGTNSSEHDSEIGPGLQKIVSRNRQPSRNICESQIVKLEMKILLFRKNETCKSCLIDLHLSLDLFIGCHHRETSLQVEDCYQNHYILKSDWCRGHCPGVFPRTKFGRELWPRDWFCR